MIDNKLLIELAKQCKIDSVAYAIFCDGTFRQINGSNVMDIDIKVKSVAELKDIIMRQRQLLKELSKI